ncbi:MAG: hypothetical protein FD174_1891 [Geobacteraceae bacterium]|nr:MAG: hypothetical protein FD174_1891 [Geobacteraceae bacterium]
MTVPKRIKGVAAATLMAGCLVVAFCSGGCAIVGGGEASGAKNLNREFTPVPGKNVVFHDKRLAGEIEITDMKCTKAGGVQKAQVSLRISPNAKDPDVVPFMYQFYWIDDKGKEIAADTNALQPAIIFGGDTVTIHGVSPDPGAREFKLIIHGVDRDHC